MASITLQHIQNPGETGRFAAALHELAVASSQLISALGAVCTPRSAPAALTVHDEADELREVARKLTQSDPRFALDLCEAADRHEWGANAGQA